MKKIFIDCGANVGQGLRQFISIFNIDHTWEIHCFEPTPGMVLEQDLMSLNNLTFHNKAVWNKKGVIEFSMCEPNPDWTEASQGSIISELYKGELPYPWSSVRMNSVEVETIDICDILKNYSPDDYIVLKLDIEGSEYEVCRRMLESQEIVKVDELFIEWHLRICSDHETLESTDLIKQQIKSFNVNLHDWH